MYQKLYTLAAIAYLIQSDPVEFVKNLERGDADSSGSTLRTVGIVALVLLVVAVLGVAIYAAANTTAGNINKASFNFK
ncbi:MAG TPA: hypothetical protein VGK87_04330 [Anaerolineae bacterium]